MTLERIARGFLAYRLSVDDFIALYFKAWRDDNVEKGNLSDQAAGSIFTACDAYDENAPGNSTSEPICEDELRVQVQMCVDDQMSALYARMGGK